MHEKTYKEWLWVWMSDTKSNVILCEPLEGGVWKRKNLLRGIRLLGSKRARRVVSVLF